MRRAPPTHVPSLAERAMELRALNFPGAQLRFFKGQRLHFDFSISPTIFSRLYRCKLCLTPNRAPEMFVMRPNLISLAEGRSLPHVYQHDGPGTKLCLWLPRKCEWVPQMRLIETYVSWTGEWLNYFEEWLISDAWAGGGEHPTPKKKRWTASSRLDLPSHQRNEAARQLTQRDNDDDERAIKISKQGIGDRSAA